MSICPMTHLETPPDYSFQKHVLTPEFSPLDSPPRSGLLRLAGGQILSPPCFAARLPAFWVSLAL